MKQKYDKEESLSKDECNRLLNEIVDVSQNIKKSVLRKTINLIRDISLLAKLHFESLENKRIQQAEKVKPKFHPVRPKRGQIFNAEIGENIGSELCGNHLVLIIQNDTGNKYSEKVNVLPIEGDGNKIKPSVHIQLKNTDLEWGKLDKDPSRVIFADILTIDKARLGLRIGKVNSSKMSQISAKLKRQLQL